MNEFREIAVLEQYVIDDILDEQRRSGRDLREILECLRDEGHLMLDEAALDDCVMQCSLAKMARE